MTFLYIILAIALIWLFVKPYVIKHDTVSLYTGSLGSGKTLVGVSDALRMLRKNRIKVFWHNLWHKDKKPKPMLYSSIPIQISKKEKSLDLKTEHILMTERITEKSVVFIDEVSLFLNSFETVITNNNVKTVEEMATLFRHYTKGGFLIMTTQNTSKCNYVIRYCCNECFNLSNFNTIPIIHFVYWHKIRHITLTDDVKTIEEGQSEDNSDWHFGFFGRRKYDTYAFSERYNTVPEGETTQSLTLKRLDFIHIPKQYIEPKTYIQEEKRQAKQTGNTPNGNSQGTLLRRGDFKKNFSNGNKKNFS